MARDPKKRQKALQRKTARRKQKRGQLTQRIAALITPSLNKAKDWPLHQVLITKDWDQQEGDLVQIVVSRRSPEGHIAVGMFLVDLGCLGVKNAFGRMVSEQEYRHLLRQTQRSQKLVPTDLNLVAKIVREAIAYARELGFSPNRDYRQAMRVVGDADPDACPEQIPLGGSDGKPFFVAGPYDNVNQIMAKLTKAVGPDGFHYMIPVAGPDFFTEDEP